ncbi:MAG: restriction endonuclease subunit S, partial [Microcoleaceae cyanobacterium]
PLNEQKRIVAKIEALQERSQRVKAELEAIRPLLDNFRQSVLAAAFRGDLTKDWREKNPDIEPASELLERIKIERRQRWEEAELEKMAAQGKTPKDEKWKQKYKEPASVDTEGLPELPDGWCWVNADQCTFLITDGEHATPKRSNNGVYLLSARNILNGKISFEKVDYVSEEVYQKLEKRLKVTTGDVLLSCSGTVGRSCIVPKDLKCAFVRSVAILKPIFSMGEYLSLALRSPQLQSQIEKKKTQTAQSNIFQGRIKTLVIPVAPLQEQTVILKAIKEVVQIADTIEQQYQKAETDLKTLNQSILAKAFRGELVPQDPNDEPASTLLEKIRAERETTNKTTKQKKSTTTKTTNRSRKKTTQKPPPPETPTQLKLPGFE